MHVSTCTVCMGCNPIGPWRHGMCVSKEQAHVEGSAGIRYCVHLEWGCLLGMDLQQWVVRYEITPLCHWGVRVLRLNSLGLYLRIYSAWHQPQARIALAFSPVRGSWGFDNPHVCRVCVSPAGARCGCVASTELC